MVAACHGLLRELVPKLPGYVICSTTNQHLRYALPFSSRRGLRDGFGFDEPIV